MKALLNRILRTQGYQMVRVEENLFHTQCRFVSKESPVIFDLGANVGQTTERYLEHWPAARLISFEPGDAAFRELTNRFRGNSQVRTEKLAVAETDGQATYYVNQGSTTNSLLPISDQSHHYMAPRKTRNISQTAVPTVSLDSYCQKQNLTQIDILKMDIQGAEEMALRGASQMLAEGRISLIYTEVLFGSLYESQASFDDICRLLRGFGYRLHSLANMTRGTDDLLSYGDAVFLAPDVLAASTEKSTAA